MKTRIHFLDNLRTFLIFLVVVLHAGIVYEPILQNYWIVSDTAKSNNLGLLRMYLDVFVMFTIFFISGYFTPASLRNKSDWEYVGSKFRRIMIPWIIAVFTLIPIYKFIFLFSRDMPQEAWYTYFHIYARTGADMGVFSNAPVQNWLWFLPVLFVFQLLYLLLSKTRLLSIRISIAQGAVLTIIVGTVYGVVISMLEMRGWYHSALLHFQNERILIYFMAFLLGTLCHKMKAFDKPLKNKKLYIWTNVALTLSMTAYTALALNFFFNMIEPGREFYFLSLSADSIFYNFSLLVLMFSFLYLLLHLFSNKFNKINPVMANLNRNSYSVYIIHMAVIGALAIPMLSFRLAGNG